MIGYAPQQEAGILIFSSYSLNWFKKRIWEADRSWHFHFLSYFVILTHEEGLGSRQNLAFSFSKSFVVLAQKGGGLGSGQNLSTDASLQDYALG